MDEIRDTFRSSLGGWLRGTAAGLATVLLGIAGLALMIGAGGDCGAWPLALTGLSIAIVMVKWLEVMGSRYEITPERLIVRKGIVMKSVDEIELYRIKDVRLNFSLLNQTAGIGTICLTSSDETTRAGDLILQHVHLAQARSEELRRLAQPVGNRTHRAAEVRRQMPGRRRLAPDVGLHQERIVHHRGPHVLFGRDAGPLGQIEFGKGIEPMANPAGSDQRGKIGGCFKDGIEELRQLDLVDFIVRKVAALARHAIV